MFTVWLPTAYSANVSAEQSVDGHISASPGIWPMADCYNVLCHSHLCITESVDSVCRDTTYTQYMLIQKNLSKSQKRYTYKPS